MNSRIVWKRCDPIPIWSLTARRPHRSRRSTASPTTSSTTTTPDARVRRMNMPNLNGKRVVITGGSQGLGLAMVESLAACGANVTAIGRDRAKLSAAAHAGGGVDDGD